MTAAALGVAAALLFFWLRAGDGFSPRPMNVVLVTADTLRADKLGCYGNPTVATPNLDALAAEGVLFENATTVAPITLPAHASMFTGAYPFEHGVRDNGGYYLEPEHTTLAERLREEGYPTGAFVGAFVLDSRFGLDQGFDRYFDDFDLAGLENAGLNSAQRSGDEVVSEALAWMESVRDRPFFSWIHLYDPHRPYDPPEPFRSEYGGESASSAYDGEVAFVDSLVGEIVAWLEEKNLMDATLIAFVGDHGEALGDHGEMSHGFFVYDATMQVPFVLRAPNLPRPGRRVSAQVRTIDVMPTVLELVGASVPDSVRGESLLSLATARVDDLDLSAYGESIFPRHYGWSDLASLRKGRYHFIEAPRPELYDVEEDPGEERNLVSRRAGIAREMREELEALRSAQARPSTAATLVDRETREKLEALGYVGAGSLSDPSDDSVALPDPKDKIELFKRVREASSDAEEGRVEDARIKLERVISEDPEVIEAYNILGNVLGRSGDLEGAAEAYRKALARDPEYKAAIFSLALTYEEMGRIEDAAAGFERILELEPRASQAGLELAQLRLDEGRFAEAVAVLESVEPATDGFSRALLHDLMAECHLGMGELDEAEARLELALHLEPRLAGAHYHRGVLFETRGEPERALEAYEAAIAISDDSSRAHFNVAKIHGQSGRAEEMIEHLEESVAADPSFIVGVLYLANAYLERGRLERARALAMRGVELGPEPSLAPFAHFILADVYQRLGRPDDAAREMERAQELQALAR